jgi:hypothetical protein
MSTAARNLGLTATFKCLPTGGQVLDAELDAGLEPAVLPPRPAPPATVCNEPRRGGTPAE